MPELGPLSHLLAVEIARHCEEIILEFKATLGPGLLRTRHLLEMCEKIEKNADDWPVTKLHRWIGFIQGCLVMAGLTTIEKESQFVRETKQKITETVDEELKDHHDSDNHFELELGESG